MTVEALSAAAAHYLLWVAEASASAGRSASLAVEEILHHPDFDPVSLGCGCECNLAAIRVNCRCSNQAPGTFQSQFPGLAPAAGCATVSVVSAWLFLSSKEQVLSVRRPGNRGDVSVPFHEAAPEARRQWRQQF